MKRPEEFLLQAAKLALKKMRQGAGGPFGALIVQNHKVISRGWNRVTSCNDPTAHAEMVAIRRAAKRLQQFNLSGCWLYTSCEPCPMCLAAAYWARLDGISYANTRDQAAAIGFDDAFLYQELVLPLEQRALPMIHLPLAAAIKAFDAWQMNPKKVRY